jgi:hypothetical protein
VGPKGTHERAQAIGAALPDKTGSFLPTFSLFGASSQVDGAE